MTTFTNYHDFNEAGFEATVFTDSDKAERDAAEWAHVYSHTVVDDGVTLKRVDYLPSHIRRASQGSYFRELKTDISRGA